MNEQLLFGKFETPHQVWNFHLIQWIQVTRTNYNTYLLSTDLCIFLEAFDLCRELGPLSTIFHPCSVDDWLRCLVPVHSYRYINVPCKAQVFYFYACNVDSTLKPSSSDTSVQNDTGDPKSSPLQIIFVSSYANCTFVFRMQLLNG